MEFCSKDITELAQAMLRVQEQLRPAIKDRTNDFTHSRYATLTSVMDACRDALHANGIWLTQYPIPVESGCLGLMTKVTHAESGQWQAGLSVVPLPKQDPQGMGIAMTYTRRYALSAMLGIVTEDDTDGEFVEMKPESRSKPQPAPPPQTQNQAFTPSKDVRFPMLPELDGVWYESLQDMASGRSMVAARGKTMTAKETLKQLGFRWNPEHKAWLKAA